MEHKLKYIAREYKHGWSLWLERDGKKIQLGTAIENEQGVETIIESIVLVKESLTDKDKLNIALKKIEMLENNQKVYESVLKSHGYVIFKPNLES